MGFGSDFNELRTAVEYFAATMVEDAAFDLWQLQQLNEFDALVKHADGLQAEHLGASDGTFAGESQILVFATDVVVDAEELVKLMRKGTDDTTGAIGGSAWNAASEAARALAKKLKGGEHLVWGEEVKFVSDLDAIDGLSARNLKDLENGQSVDFWQNGDFLFVGDGFPDFVQERSKKGSITVKKAGWTNHGTVRVVGGGDASQFETGLRRFSKKVIVR